MDSYLPQRKHPRLKHYDYSTAGAYFVTICTQNRRCLLSRIVGRGVTPAEIQYTVYGQIAEEQLFLLEKRYPSMKIDQYVIMPNHIHAIFILEETAIATAPALRPQTSFYEHGIRGREDYNEIAEYIVNLPNPLLQKRKKRRFSKLI